MVKVSNKTKKLLNKPLKQLTDREKAICENHYERMMSITDSVIGAGYYQEVSEEKQRSMACTFGNAFFKREYVATYCLMKYGRCEEPNKKFVEQFEEKQARESIKRIENGNNLFDYIVGKLKRIIDVNVPDDNISKEELIDNKKILSYNFSSAISAIAEISKLHGFYAPVKNVNVNLNDSPEVRRLIEISDKIRVEAFKDKNNDII